MRQHKRSVDVTAEPVAVLIGPLRLLQQRTQRRRPPAAGHRNVPSKPHHSGAAVGGRHGSCYTTSSLNALFTTRDSMRYDHAAAGGLSAPAAIRPPPGGGAITVTNLGIESKAFSFMQACALCTARVVTGRRTAVAIESSSRRAR